MTKKARIGKQARHAELPRKTTDSALTAAECSARILETTIDHNKDREAGAIAGMLPAADRPARAEAKGVIERAFIQLTQKLGEES